MAYDTLAIEDHGAVRRILLARPAQRNAQSQQMLDELIDAFGAAGRDEAVRVVVLGGQGEHFSAGHDLKQAQADLSLIGDSLGESVAGAAEAMDRMGADIGAVRDAGVDQAAGVEETASAVGQIARNIESLDSLISSQAASIRAEQANLAPSPRSPDRYGKLVSPLMQYHIPRHQLRKILESQPPSCRACLKYCSMSAALRLH